LPEHSVNAILTANSTKTISSSSEEIRASILDAIERLNENDPNTKLNAETGHYISSIGSSRIVWRKQDDKILVLTVFAPSA